MMQYHVSIFKTNKNCFIYLVLLSVSLFTLCTRWPLTAWTFINLHTPGLISVNKQFFENSLHETPWIFCLVLRRWFLFESWVIYMKFSSDFIKDSQKVDFNLKNFSITNFIKYLRKIFKNWKKISAHKFDL